MQTLIAACLKLLTCSLIVSRLACAQSPVQTEPAWQRYTFKGEEVSALLPEQPETSIYYRLKQGVIIPTDEKRLKGRLFSAYGDGVVYLIYSYDNPHHSESLDTFIKEFERYWSNRLEITSSRDIKLDGVSGKRLIFKFKDEDGIVDFYDTDKHVYIVQVVGGNESHPSVERFLQSLALGKNAAGTDSRSGEGVKPTAQAAQSGTHVSPQSGPVYSAQEVTRKALIVMRREPQYTEEARQNHISGTVELKAVLSSSGKITDVEVLKGLSHGLTEKAIEATRQTMFIPAMKDGKYVSQRIMMQYGFSVY
jgi:TonB family protein